VTQGIYEIVNLVDGKASTYIGSSVGIEKRWCNHRAALRAGWHANAHLQAAWNLYGEDAFVFSMLEEVEDDMLLAMEQEYLDDYFDRGHCYNIATTAGPAGPLSVERKRKISEALRGHKVSEETRRKISKAKKGQKPPEETRRRMSEAAKGNQKLLGYKHTEEARRKMSEAAIGRILSEETRHKISKSNMGRVLSEETRHKISKGKMGKVFSEEHRRNLSKPYPAFIHRETGAIILAGRNLSAMCERYGLNTRHMNEVKNGKRKSHKGWVLLFEENLQVEEKSDAAKD